MASSVRSAKAEYWQDIVDQFQQSGQTVQAFPRRGSQVIVFEVGDQIEPAARRRFPAGGNSRLLRRVDVLDHLRHRPGVLGTEYPSPLLTMAALR